MIIKGPYQDVSIPKTALTPFVLRRVSDLGDKPALIDGPTGRTLTFAQLADSISIAAYNLAQRGFKKGEVFGILSPNCPEYAIVFHAVATLGGIVTPINPLYTHHEIEHQLKDSGARFLVTVPGCAEKAGEAAKAAGVEELFVFGSAPGATSFDSLLIDNGRAEQVEVDPLEDLIALPYSSGTTGLPKGVMLTHHNLVANIRQMEGLCYFYETDTLICVLPLFHIYGLVVVLNMGLYSGSTIVTMPRFDLESFLKAVQDYNVSLAHLVPPIVLAQLQPAEPQDNLFRCRATRRRPHARVHGPAWHQHSSGLWND
jgi:acyl-CoA synthetase (AMP-forming)/AMP-acid ligase II